MRTRTTNADKRDYVIVFGAAVRANGRPSAALRRRIEAASAWAKKYPRSIIMPTGGVGDHGRAEAKVVRDALIADGVTSRRIVMELDGHDTLESVMLCHKLIQRRGDCERVVCCTSRYHQPRCSMLLRLLGYRVVLPKIPIRRGHLTRFGLVRLFVRELAALPYDALMLSVSRAVNETSPSYR